MAKSIKVALQLDTSNFDRGLRNSEERVGGLTGKLGGLKTAIAGLATGFAVKGIVDATLKMEQYRSTLTAYLGDQTKANEAIARLSALANTLPQDLDDVTESFIILQRNGIATGNEALEAFAKVAAGNSKTMSQLSEAVADALTGEFERLKEFGVKVAKENDQFVIRMADGSTQIVNSAREVVDAVRAQGEEGGKFAEVVAGPLNQAFSNLRGITLEVSAAFGDGLAPALTDASERIKEALENNKEFIATLGKLVGEGLALLIENLDIVIPLIGAFAAGWTAIKFAELASGLAGLVTGFKALTVAMMANPIGLIVGSVTALIAGFIALVDHAGSVSNALKMIGNAGIEAFNFLVNLGQAIGTTFINAGKIIGESMAYALNPTNWGEEFDIGAFMSGKLNEAIQDVQAIMDEETVTFRFTLDPINEEAAAETLEDFNKVKEELHEQDVRRNEQYIEEINKLQLRIEQLEERLRLFDENKAEMHNSELERTAEQKEATIDLQNTEQTKHDQSVANHEQQMTNDQLEIQTTIEKNILQDENNQLQQVSNEKKQTSNQLSTEGNQIEIPAQVEKNGLLGFFNDLLGIKLTKIGENTAATQNEQGIFTTGWNSAWGEYEQTSTGVMKGQKTLWGTTMQAMGGAFNQFVRTGKVDFKSLIDEMISQLKRIVAKKIFVTILDILGLGGIASIFEGFFDKGGKISAGKFGIVGEKGPEIVTGPASVIGREQTADMLSGLAGGSVTYNIQAVDARSFKQLVAQDPEFIYNVTQAGSRRLPV